MTNFRVLTLAKLLVLPGRLATYQPTAMRGFWLLPLALIAIVGMACTGGAQTQDILETSDVIPVQVEKDPMLTELDTFLLARTYILIHRGDGINEELCFGEQTKQTLVKQQIADYRDGMWAVRTSGGCAFVIDDRTGKVLAAPPAVGSFWPGAAKDWVVILQAGATLIALGIAAILGYLRFGWFRTTQPHATISHQIAHREVGYGTTHLEIEVSIFNSSKVVLKFRDGRVNVWRLTAADAEELQQRKEEIDRGEDPRWPVLARRPLALRPGAMVVEPGETDVRLYEFLIPNYVVAVVIDTYFWNQRVVKHKTGQDPHDQPRRKNLLCLEVKGPRVWRRSSIYTIQRGTG